MENPLFRIGLEIETCFANKPSKTELGSSSCVFIKEQGEKCPCPVRFLTTTHAPDSLFKGVPELVSYCLKGENACNVELIINRFDLNKRKAKFLHFVRQIINLKIKMKNNFLGMLEVQEKKIKILQLIWKLRFCINSKKQGMFE